MNYEQRTFREAPPEVQGTPFSPNVKQMVSKIEKRVQFAERVHEPTTPARKISRVPKVNKTKYRDIPTCPLGKALHHDFFRHEDGYIYLKTHPPPVGKPRCGIDSCSRVARQKCGPGPRAVCGVHSQAASYVDPEGDLGKETFWKCKYCEETRVDGNEKDELLRNICGNCGKDRVKKINKADVSYELGEITLKELK